MSEWFRVAANRPALTADFQSAVKMNFRIKQKWKNLFWQFYGIFLSIGLIASDSILLKSFGIISIIILVLGILFTLLIKEEQQINLPRPVALTGLEKPFN